MDVRGERSMVECDGGDEIRVAFIPEAEANS